MKPEILKQFDPKVGDQIHASIRSGSSETFFLFSGPPNFSNLAERGTTLEPDLSLCPLLFTTSFADGKPTNPYAEYSSMGTSQTYQGGKQIVNGGTRQLSVGANSQVTRNPKSISASTKEDWNLLKRLYYAYITNPVFSAWLGEGGSAYGSEKDNPNAVAPEYSAIWGNFNAPEIYDMPIGILAISLTSSYQPLKMCYYEGVNIKQAAGYDLEAGVGQPVRFAGSRGFSARCTSTVTFTKDEISSLLKVGGEDTGFVTAVLNTYFSPTGA